MSIVMPAFASECNEEVEQKGLGEVGTGATARVSVEAEFEKSSKTAPPDAAPASMSAMRLALN